MIVVGIVLVLAAQITKWQLKDKGDGTTDEVPADGPVQA